MATLVFLLRRSERSSGETDATDGSVVWSLQIKCTETVRLLEMIQLSVFTAELPGGSGETPHSVGVLRDVECNHVLVCSTIPNRQLQFKP